MAKVKAPLLSLGASGQIAGTLVASTWKGLKTMREYVKPANPRTAAQTTQRTAFTDAVSAFRNYLTSAAVRAAWDRLALASGKAQSGFNACMSALLAIIKTDPDASFASAATANSGGYLDFTCVNVDDGATGDETGAFVVWEGTSPGSLLPISAGGALSAGVWGEVSSYPAGTEVYCKLRKDGVDRSGIHKLTVLA